MANTSSTAANIIQYAASFLNQFAQRNFPDSHSSDKDKFKSAVDTIFKAYSTIGDLWNQIQTDYTSYTYSNISSRKAGDILLWDNSSSDFGMGIVLPDNQKILVLNPNATKLSSVPINNYALLGGFDTEGLLKVDLSLLSLFNVEVPYNNQYPRHHRPIQGDRLTGRLTGIVVFKADSDFTINASIPSFQSYVNTCVNNIVNTWTSTSLVSLITTTNNAPAIPPITLSPNSTPQIQNLSTFQPIGWSNLALNPLDEVLFLIDDTGGNINDLVTSISNHPLLESTSIPDFLFSRMAYITVGDGASSSSAVSHVTLPPRLENQDTGINLITTGYFIQSRMGREAAHEFGHLAGLADRYVECVKYRPTGYNSILRVDYNSNEWLITHDLARYGHPFYQPNAISKRVTIPIVFDDGPTYEHWHNLMCAPNVDQCVPTLSLHQLEVVLSTNNNNINSLYNQYPNDLNNLCEITPFHVHLFMTEAEAARLKNCNSNPTIGTNYTGIEFIIETVVENGIKPNLIPPYPTSTDPTIVSQIQPDKVIPVSFTGMRLYNLSTMTFDSTKEDSIEKNSTEFINNNQFFKLDERGRLDNGQYGIIKLMPLINSRPDFSGSNYAPNDPPRFGKSSGLNQNSRFHLRCTKKFETLLNTTAYPANDDFRNISFAPKWFIENNMNTNVQINANNTAKR